MRATLPIERVPNLFRFAVTGGVCALFQLGMLHAMVGHDLPKGVANLIALVVSAQVNFFLSHFFTWSERRDGNDNPRDLLNQMVRFNGMIATTMLVNQITFEIASVRLDYLLAGALAILVAGSINFVASDHLIFARR